MIEHQLRDTLRQGPNEHLWHGSALPTLQSRCQRCKAIFATAIKEIGCVSRGVDWDTGQQHNCFAALDGHTLRVACPKLIQFIHGNPNQVDDIQIYMFLLPSATC